MANFPLQDISNHLSIEKLIKQETLTFVMRQYTFGDLVLLIGEAVR
jgi:hypothetical protein